MKPPRTIKPYVESFARQVLKTAGSVDLTYLPCSPLNSLSDGDCFPCVQDYARDHGGTSIIGWAMWERPKMLIEAEFHSVWESSEGVLHDIVPRRLPIPRILFLRDSRRLYKGRQVDNIRKALTNDKDVKELIRVFEIAHTLWNEGELADYHGEVDLLKYPKLFAIEDRKAAICAKLDERYGRPTLEGNP